MSLLICLIVMVSIVLIWDWFNAPNEIASQLMNWLSKGKITQVELKKPWGCSTCLTFWITLVILLVMSPQLCWMSLVYAFFAKYTLYIIDTVDRLITKIFVLLQKIL